MVDYMTVPSWSISSYFAKANVIWFFDYFTGCLLDPDVCDQHENCFDDYAFGRCVSPYDAYDGD